MEMTESNVNVEGQLQVTNVIQLQEYAKGQIVVLPSFGEGQPFVARLKRPSMLALAKRGKIPNALLESASTLFEGGVQGALNMMDDKAMESLYEVMDVICEASFVEPSYEQIKNSGIELTDEQLMFVFSYSQNGVRQLDSFRQE